VFRQGDLAAKAHIVRSGRIEPRAVNGETFPRAPASLPWLTTAQMIEVDRIMIDDLGIGLAQMMESAGRDLAQLTRVRSSAATREAAASSCSPGLAATVLVRWSPPAGCPAGARTSRW